MKISLQSREIDGVDILFNRTYVPLSSEEERSFFSSVDALEQQTERLKKEYQRASPSERNGKHLRWLAENDKLERSRAEARGRFAEYNLNLVAGLTITFHNKNPSLDLEDVYSEAMAKYNDVIQGFDWRLGWKFSTYAFRSIYKGLIVSSQRGKLRTASRFSLDASLPSGEGKLLDMVKDTRSPSPESGLEKGVSKETRDSIGLALEKVSGRDRTIVEMRYGLNGFDHPFIYDDIARALKLSREGVRKIAFKTLGLLRQDVDLAECARLEAS